jgi:hypothetical protein
MHLPYPKGVLSLQIGYPYPGGFYLPGHGWSSRHVSAFVSVLCALGLVVKM